MRLKYPVLFRRGEPTIQRQDLGLPPRGITRKFTPAQQFGGFANVPFCGHENEYVAAIDAGQLVHRLNERSILVAERLEELFHKN